MMKVYRPKFNKLISKHNLCLMYMTVILLLILGLSRTCPESTLVLIDSNIPAETMQYICDACSESQMPGMQFGLIRHF